MRRNIPCGNQKGDGRLHGARLFFSFTRTLVILDLVHYQQLTYELKSIVMPGEDLESGFSGTLRSNKVGLQILYAIVVERQGAEFESFSRI